MDTVKTIDYKLTSQEMRSCIMLLFLYYLEGILIALPYNALVILFAEQGASYSQLAILTAVSYPYSFKILWAPFQDVHYFEKFGKRKSYIVPTLLIIGIICLIGSFSIEQLVQEKRVLILGLFGMLCVFLSAVSDVSIDGWVTMLFPQEKRSNGSVCQSFGQNFGWITSQHLFILANSDSFCIKTLGLSSKMVSLHGYVMFIGVIYLLAALYLFLFITEINPEQGDFGSVLEVFKQLKHFFTNRDIRYVCLIFLFYRFGFAPIDSAGYLTLIKQGFPKVVWVEMSLSLTPLQLIIPPLIGKYFQSSNIDMKLFAYLLIMKTIDSFIWGIAIYTYVGPGTGGMLVYIFYVNLLFQQVANHALFVVVSSFIFRIGDKAVGATYISFMGSMSNFGRYFIEPFAISLLDYMPFITVNILGMIYEALFIYFNFKHILNLDNTDLQKFLIIQTETDIELKSGLELGKALLNDSNNNQSSQQQQKDHKIQ